MESVKETVLDIIEDIKPGAEVEGRTDLATGHVLESFDILQLISELNDEFDIVIPLEDVIPANFDSLEGIVKLVERLKA